MPHRYTKYSRAIIRLSYWYCKVVGIASANYHPDRREFIPALRNVIYGTLVNSAAVGLIIPLAYIAMKKHQVTLFDDNKLLLQIETVNSVINTVVVVATLVKNWIDGRGLIQFSTSLLRTNLDFSAEYETERSIELRLFVMLAAKMIVTNGLNVAHSVLYFQRFGHFDALIMAIWCCAFIISNIVETVICIFFGSVVHISKFYHLLNKQLQRLTRRVKTASSLRGMAKQRAAYMALCCDLSDAIDDLARKYDRVYNLQKTLNGLCQFQMLIATLTIYTSSITMAYYIYKMAAPEVNSNMVGAMAGCLVLYIAEMGLMFDAICDSIIAAKDSRDLLQTIACYHGLDERLERSIELLTYQQMRHEVLYGTCGLFFVNRPFVLAFISSSILNFIMLIQFDYKIN